MEKAQKQILVDQLEELEEMQEVRELLVDKIETYDELYCEVQGWGNDFR
ncbi:hypothetical protein B834_2614 [Enterococcus mundtii 1A]|nr:hypothetical protein [Enterococcus mundtii 1A]